MLDELNDMVEKHGDERRSYIDPMPLSMDREDLIEERAIAITLSEDNYIRHLPVEAFRVQNRGGKGLKGVTTKQEDTPQLIITCFSKDRLLIFTDQGRVYGLKAWETPLGSRLSRGGHIRNLLESLREDENIVSILPLSRDLLENPAGHYLLFATKKGLIKKTKLEEYVRINRNGKYALRFKLDGDSLVNVRSGTDEADIVMISSTGFASRFACSNIRASGRVSGGVYGIKTGDRKDADGGHVVAMIATNNPETNILTVTKNGMAKRSRLGTADRLPILNEDGSQKLHKETNEPMFKTDGYRKTRPGAKGAFTMNIDSDDEIISAKHIPDLGDNLFILTKKGMMIRIVTGQTKDTKTKKSKGTRIMELRNKSRDGYVDEIIFTARLPAELLEDDQFETMDTDGDGVISREEFEAAQQSNSLEEE